MSEWNKIINIINEETIKIQEQMDLRYDLNKYDTNVLDLNNGAIYFIIDKKVKAWGNVQIVGTIDKKENLWDWSYFDENIPDKSKTLMAEIKTFGEKNEFIALINTKWKAEDVDGLQMSSIALNIMRGLGIYKTEDKNKTYYLILEDLKIIKNDKNKLKIKI